MAEDITPADDKQSARERKRAEREAKKREKQEERERKKTEKANASAAGGESGGGGPLGGVRQWLVDTYNGLFKIVIQPQLPSPQTILLLMVAFILGMIFAYGLFPVGYYDGAYNQLDQTRRDLYMILVSGSYSAGLYDDATVVELLSRVENPAGNIDRLIAAQTGEVQRALQNIQPLAQQAGAGTAAPNSGNILASLLDFIIAGIIFFVLIIAVTLLWRLLIGGFVERFLARLRPKTEADLEAERVRDDIRRRKELQAQLEAASAAEDATSTVGPAILNRVSPYTRGRAYDDSFAIEDANDMFLGECGATIAKTIGDSQELTAIEIWLFDKEDFVKTYTKLLVSQHAYNDPVIRSELDNRVDDPANDLVVIAPGASVTLESKKLRVKATVADVTPGNEPGLPPNSHFEALTLQMQAWELEGAATPAAPVPAAAGGLPDLSSYEIGPPPEMPSGAGNTGGQQGSVPPPPPPPPQSSGLPDLSSYEIGPPPELPSNQPPPPQPPSGGFNSPTTPGRPPVPPPLGNPGDDDDDDDDPFGGTGDFTPLGS